MNSSCQGLRFSWCRVQCKGFCCQQIKCSPSSPQISQLLVTKSLLSPWKVGFLSVHLSGTLVKWDRFPWKHTVTKYITWGCVFIFIITEVGIKLAANYINALIIFCFCGIGSWHVIALTMFRNADRKGQSAGSLHTQIHYIMPCSTVLFVSLLIHNYKFSALSTWANLNVLHY